MNRGAEIVVVGSEILSAKIRDTNSPWLIGQLRELGVTVDRVTTIHDQIDVIAKIVVEASERAAFVITTGGVGPTLDDLTFAGIAAGFGCPLRPFPEMTRVIQQYFHGQATPAHLRMADLPGESELVFSPNLVFPVVRVRNVYVLPGSPEILQKKFLAIRETFRSTPFHLRSIDTHQEEGLLAPALDRLHALLPAVTIGSYPTYANPDHAVHITLEAKDRAVVDQAVDTLLGLLDRSLVVRVT